MVVGRGHSVASGDPQHPGRPGQDQTSQPGWRDPPGEEEERWTW